MSVRLARPSFLAALLATAVLVPEGASARSLVAPRPDAAFDHVIQRVEAMTWDENVRAPAAREGLSVVNVTWEDTGRSKGSSVGPNISDLTIGVRDTAGMLHPMPVLRFDNFSDVTADVPLDRLFLRVGNERGRTLRPASLKSVLGNLRGYLHDPGSWAGSGRSLLAGRDSHVVVSAQACFLPVPLSRAATFTPMLYNYQSSPGDPAVLTLVATREGTSVQIVDNDGGYMSEELPFNQDGMAAPYTATRLSDYRAQNGAAAASEPGLDMVMVIQVPLKHREVPSYGYGDFGGMVMESAPAPMAAARGRSDVETAVIGHGPVEGPFSELGHLPVERDPRFPIRVTVQFYRATATGVVTADDIAAVRAQIDRVYRDADYVGSLVTEGFTGRPTETKPAVLPVTESRWADPFWAWR